MLEAIVAVYSDWGIGANGTQPVVVKADRRHFREVTGGSAVIVGRRTLADFPGGRPLKGRENIVLTRQSIEIPGAENLTVGQKVFLNNGMRSFPVQVTAKDETTITFDANHEMAGKELNFKIELVELL